MTHEEAKELIRVQPLIEAEMKEIESTHQANIDARSAAFHANPSLETFDELAGCEEHRREMVVALLAKYCPFLNTQELPSGDISIRIDNLGDGHAALMILSSHAPKEVQDLWDAEQKRMRELLGGSDAR